MIETFAYLDDPEMVGENQEPPHVIVLPFADVVAARDGDNHSPWVLPLDGAWRFAYADRPDGVPAGFTEPGHDVSGWDVVAVPHVWQQDGYDHPIDRNAPSEIAPYDPPRVPKDVNPTGAYVRRFDVPDGWDGRRVFLRFEGVTGGYFVWLNGDYVGYDQGGYTPAEFDVTRLARRGTNVLAVRVHRWSAGGYLENMDMWHLSGIFRSVWLYSTPQVRIRDVDVRTDLDEQCWCPAATAATALSTSPRAGTRTTTSTGRHTPSWSPPVTTSSCM